MLVTLQEAKAHLRMDHDLDDDDITLKLKAATSSVKNYLKAKSKDVYYEKDEETGEISKDENGDSIVRAEIKAAILILLDTLYEDRGIEKANSWQHGYLPTPVMNLLYPLRDPAWA